MILIKIFTYCSSSKIKDSCGVKQNKHHETKHKTNIFEQVLLAYTQLNKLKQFRQNLSIPIHSINNPACSLGVGNIYPLLLNKTLLSLF